MLSASGQTQPRHPWAWNSPPTPVLALSFLLAGLGTVVLGPLLPQLLAEWALSDQQGGFLLFAKFVGAFTGGALVPARLRLGVVAGHLVAAVGFALFSVSHGLLLALPALFLTGIGLGEIIASTNILAGRRWSEHTGSALALLNFFWSFGAVGTGLLAAGLLPRYGWRTPTLALAGLLALAGILNAALAGVPYPPPSVEQAHPRTSQLRLLARFGGLLFLYGGLETCLTAWLTTFSQRFAGGHILGGQSGFVVLWAALTVGRVIASGLLRRLPEKAVLQASLGGCLVLIAWLALVHTAGALALTCILLGLALAPVFPSTFALLLRRAVAPRTAGFLLALSGLGAAVFPALMGTVSTRAASLRWAMIIPALLVPAMFLLTPEWER